MALKRKLFVETQDQLSAERQIKTSTVYLGGARPLRCANMWALYNAFFTHEISHYKSFTTWILEDKSLATLKYYTLRSSKR
jgi:hypothetical protein